MLNKSEKKQLKDIIISPNGKVQFNFEDKSIETLEFDISIHSGLMPVDNAITTLLCLILEQSREIENLQNRILNLEQAKTKVY